MEKVYTYTLWMVGILLLLKITGVLAASGTFIGQLDLGDPSSFTNFYNSALFDKINSKIALIAGLGVAAAVIVLGVFGRQVSDLPVSAAIAATLILFVTEIATITTNMFNQSQWAGYLMLLIFGPLTFGYLIALWDWVRGRD